MSDAIIGRIDEMGSRIDDLEKSIGELMEQVRIASHVPAPRHDCSQTNANDAAASAQKPPAAATPKE
ncbi:hypothetical protein DYB37_000646 [Aphanomyces astaci]|uniref:Uncharacterized protein n=1 Tax=Aphanomyces astaci TaxID=112090 RepID=A0A397CK70_APHAT|nr:hypothetical protein DYB25_002034 [Aphanomyces astaci]RHY05741.1 hypothetical protein DYB36_005941 [Aphanomyces astaci]RHY36438.1 hypothetical protein DYB34_001216 [Aphanomyces astaci]RHY45023.1 hypothetical protein DYB30_000713 [Aphanomyces astaci]RHY48647.1 hypothetical protein DYB38_000353 [Aphanomyces astaci]